MDEKLTIREVRNNLIKDLESEYTQTDIELIDITGFATLTGFCDSLYIEYEALPITNTPYIINPIAKNFTIFPISTVEGFLRLLGTSVLKIWFKIFTSLFLLLALYHMPKKL